MAQFLLYSSKILLILNANAVDSGYQIARLRTPRGLMENLVPSLLSLQGLDAWHIFPQDGW